VFALIGNTNGVHELCEKLLSYQMGHVEISVGEKLSYKGERITTGTPRELMEQEFSPLCVVLVTNDQAEKRKVHGIPDEAFLRDKVPMTKEEVRSVSLSKLGLTEDAICYDIGAGTGSVSVEMAIQAPEGQVYAVEKKKEAVALLLKNKEHFAVDNLEIIEGLAPEAMEALPAPTHVFVGGSSGNLKAILENVFEKNQKARVVINAITLETVAEAMECIRELPVEDVDIVTIQTGKAKEAGAYHLMMGQNPVYVFSFTGGAQR
jgi:precorrin-6Y C5,15-methyltransferase (decarboxylating)